MRSTFLFVICLLFLSSLLFPSASGLGQSTANDSQGIQALVAEVRQLRVDLHATNASALRAQVLLYRLQVQEATVARVSQHLNDERSRLAQAQEHRRNLAAGLKGNEERMESGISEITPTDIARLKAELENLAAEEQQRQTAEMEAEEQLRVEQAKLSGLEDRVDRLEKELEGPH